MNPLATRRRAIRAWVTTLVVAGSLTLAQQAMSLDRIHLEPTGIGRPGDQMGRSVALLGDTAVVGAPGSQVINGVNSGTVDIYRLQNGVWQQEAMLSPSNPLINQGFGHAVSLGPDLVVVAADGDGELYTFERTGAAWQQVDQRDGDGLGADQIGLSGDTLVYGDTIFVRSGSGWEEQSVLVPDDPSGTSWPQPSTAISL